MIIVVVKTYHNFETNARRNSAGEKALNDEPQKKLLDRMHDQKCVILAEEQIKWEQGGRRVPFSSIMVKGLFEQRHFFHCRKRTRFQLIDIDSGAELSPIEGEFVSSGFHGLINNISDLPSQQIIHYQFNVNIFF